MNIKELFEQYQKEYPEESEKVNIGLDFFDYIQKQIDNEMEDYGRQCFYDGRVITKFVGFYGNSEKGAIFKHPTYNGYLREREKYK